MIDVVRETGLRYRNWGKWGADDERGTLNYITPETIALAAGRFASLPCRLPANHTPRTVGAGQRGKRFVDLAEQVRTVHQLAQLESAFLI